MKATIENEANSVRGKFRGGLDSKSPDRDRQSHSAEKMPKKFK